MIKSIINVGSQAILKLLFSVVSLKIVAYYAGPSGMAVLGQLQSFLQIAAAGASSMTSTGVVKLISEGRHEKEKILGSSFVLLVAYSLILLVLFLIFAGDISSFFLGEEWLVAVSVIPLTAFVLGVNSLFISYYNGRQDYRRYFLYSVFLSFSTAIITIVMGYYFHREGAVYSIVVAPIAAGIFLILLFRGWVRSWKSLPLSEFLPVAKNLLKFTLMAIGSALVVYGGQIYLRHFISSNVSVDAAGIWYSATRLSDIYIGMASVLFSTILLPRYSSLIGGALFSEALKMLVIACVASLLLIATVNIASGFVVRIIYGEGFNSAASVLDLYVLGDALKVITWTFLYILIAKQKVRFYLGYEILSAVAYVLLSILAYKYFGFYNMALGYVAQAAISLGALLLWFLMFSDRQSFCAEVASD